MNAKQLAESMVDGSLNYRPENDAYSIAKSYLELAGLVEKTFSEYNTTGHLSTKLCLEVIVHLDADPALRIEEITGYRKG
ncbi:MAG: hypothetical protein KUG81_09880 [Gammaproteobacteria bacterium]|nr:hypothetical protein [Gammaproteobacteria bacterium]